MAKIIIGFCGRISSGKGTACDYYKNKYQAETVMFSQSLRDVLNRLHMEISRENMQKLSTVLRENFSQDILAKVVSSDAESAKAELVVIDGIRRPKDIEYLKALPGFSLVSIVADAEKRWQRLVSRGQNKDDAEKTFAQFKIDEMQEADAMIDEVGREAKFVVNNSDDLSSLYKQLDDLLAQCRLS